MGAILERGYVNLPPFSDRQREEKLVIAEGIEEMMARLRAEVNKRGEDWLRQLLPEVTEQVQRSPPPRQLRLSPSPPARRRRTAARRPEMLRAGTSRHLLQTSPAGACRRSSRKVQIGTPEDTDQSPAGGAIPQGARRGVEVARPGNQRGAAAAVGPTQG
ncbi:hypothetical protein XELAEV_18007363mg [Xenopus laevis]|uniref:Uncharacterized protein n=1 Tax=Xenopus laevis TaxID=8355 RepID=A0A974E2X7_XENLA|nr:hypothetical protein XELAEV_18007363mg [Xenopus laevis]